MTVSETGRHTEGGVNWIDISHVKSRTYYMKSGNRIHIVGPTYLYVKQTDKGDSHRIITNTGVRYYISAGEWEAFEQDAAWKHIGKI